jgi:hypothetical protein
MRSYYSVKWLDMGRTAGLLSRQKKIPPPPLQHVHTGSSGHCYPLGTGDYPWSKAAEKWGSLTSIQCRNLELHLHTGSGVNPIQWVPKVIRRGKAAGAIEN